MNIIISNSSDLPIYEQIVEQIKAMILQGDLKEGDALPSMRTLAKELRISVITTKRAYEELEKDGFIQSFTGKGSFVSPKNLNLYKEESLKKIESTLEQAIELGAAIGLSPAELSEMLLALSESD
ncbi:MAG: GntR family transcriptional regulator [Lachnospiraceae bacterium]|nr:GntR family transcriptional regulator [Lachnospiraceae bacterium]